MDDKQFTGKVVFITGATSGIGRACALKFATAGASVACVGRNESALQKITKDIQSLGGETLALQADKKASFGTIVRVMDALKLAGVRNLPAFTREEK